VALDGTKLRARASRHKAMSYQRMVRRERDLEAEIDRMLAEAERQDTAEDERLGPEGRDDDLPQELNRQVDRLLKIREAKEALEEEARAGRRPRRRPSALRSGPRRGDEGDQGGGGGEQGGAQGEGAAQLHRPRRQDHEDGAFHERLCVAARSGWLSRLVRW